MTTWLRPALAWITFAAIALVLFLAETPAEPLAAEATALGGIPASAVLRAEPVLASGRLGDEPPAPAARPVPERGPPPLGLAEQPSH